LPKRKGITIKRKGEREVEETGPNKKNARLRGALLT